MTRNLARRRYRSELRLHRREEHAARPEATLPTAEIVQRETAIRGVLDAVFRLEEPYRSVVVLRYYEDLEPQAIADRLGIPPATVRSRLHRGLELLRGRLDRAYGDDRAAWVRGLLPLAVAGFGATAAGTAAAASAASAATAATTAAGSSAGSTAFTAFGVLVMTKKLVAAGLLVVAAAASAYFFSTSSPSTPGTPPPVRSTGNSEALAPAAPEARPPKNAGAAPSPIASAPFKTKPEDEAPGAARSTPARASLQGRIVDEAGHPLEGVPLRLTLTRSRATASGEVDEAIRTNDTPVTTSDREGRFSVRDVDLGVEARILAVPREHCDVSRTLLVDAAREIDLGDLVATAGATVSGRVLDADGRPVAQATIDPRLAVDGFNAGGGLFAFEGVPTAPGYRRTTTDEHGRFVATGLAAGPYRIRVHRDGRAPWSSPELRVAKAERKEAGDFTLPGGRGIAGIVRDRSGQALAGAEISATPTELVIDTSNPAPAAGSGRATSGPDGRFEISGLAAVAHNVRATKQGYSRSRQDGIVPDASLEIVLDPSATIVGSVVSAKDGAPIETFRVAPASEDVVLRMAAGADARGPRVLVGDEAAAWLGIPGKPGLFVVTDLSTAEIVLETSAPGFATRQSERIALAPGTRIEKELRLDPETILAGVVVSPSGTPIAGASVAAELPSDSEEIAPGPPGSRSRRIRRRVEAGTGGRVIESDAEKTAITDAEGRFRLVGLAAGSYRVVATHSEHAPSAGLELKLGVGQHELQLRLPLRSGGALTGRTLGERGQPLAGARVNLTAIALDDANPEAPQRSSAPTGADGRYSLQGLLPGLYRARIDHPDSSPSAGMVFVADTGAEAKGTDVRIAAGETTTLDLKEPVRATVFGRVTEAGRPVEGVAVRLREDSDAFMLGGPEVRTDVDGRFGFPRTEVGRYRVSVSPPGSGLPIGCSVEVTGPRDVAADVELPTGALEGRVLDSTGKPVQGVEITVQKPRKDGETRREAVMVAITDDGSGESVQTIRIGDQMKPPTTDAEGRFTVRYLEEGSYDVRIRGSGVIPATKPGVAVRHGDVTSKVDFTARRGARLSVTIEGVAQNSTVLARLTKAPAPGAGPDDAPPVDFKVGSPRGPIVFDGLEPGTYLVQAENPGSAAKGETEVVVGEGVDATATVRLR